MVKKYGIGSTSILIAIIATMFSFTSLGGADPIGKSILSALGIKFPYEIVSLILFIIGFLIGMFYKQHSYAKAGKTLSMVMIALMLVLTFMSLIANIMI